MWKEIKYLVCTNSKVSIRNEKYMVKNTGCLNTVERLDDSIAKIWKLSKIKQKSVVPKLGEFLIMYFHLFSIFINERINWGKRMAETKFYKMFYEMNIVIYQLFSPSSNKAPFKKVHTIYVIH